MYPSPPPRFTLKLPAGFVRVVGTGLTLLLFALNAFAEPNRKDNEEEDILLQEMTVIGTSLSTDVQLYPGSVTILNEDDLKTTSTPIEAMNTIPGVTLGGDVGRGMGQGFNIRGFGYGSEDRVIILQDGVRRSPSLYANQMSSFRSDNDLLKRVEVVKGASSVSHGSGAIGGVVEMTTKDAYDFIASGQNFGLATKFRYEENNLREGYVAFAAAPEKEKYELLVYGKKTDRGDLTLAEPWDKKTGKDKIDNDEDLRVLFIKGAYNFTDASRLAISYYDFNQDTVATWQSLFNTEYSSQTGPVRGTVSQQDFVATYSYNPYSDWINFSATAYNTEASYDRGYAYTHLTNGAQKLDYENEDQRWGIRLRNEMTFNALSARNRLLLGVDYENREEDATYVLNGVKTVFGSMPNTYKDIGVFAHLESAFFDERLTLQLSGRYDDFDRKVDGKGGSYSGDHFSPRVGLSARLFEGFHLLGNYSESFRAPTPHETSSEGPLNINYYYQPNPDLKPEIAKEFEFGFSYTKRELFSSRDRLRLKAMYFDGKVEDMIVLVPDFNGPTPPASNYYATYKNVDKVSRDGYEISAAYDAPLGGLGVGWSHLDQTDDATGKKTPQGFADKATLNVYVKPVQNLTVGATILHWFKPDQNPKTVISGGAPHWYVRDDYTQVNFIASYSPDIRSLNLFCKELEILFGVNNAFDQLYINARDVETTQRIAKGRNIFFSISAKF